MYDDDIDVGFFSYGDLKKAYKKAKGVASKVKKLANNKYTGKILKSKYAKAVAEELPGGAKTLKLANKAHEYLVKAKAGDPNATKKLAQVKALANQGDFVAKSVIDTTRVMSKMLDTKLVIETETKLDYYRLGVTAVGWNPLKKLKKAAKRAGRFARRGAKLPFGIARKVAKVPFGIAREVSRVPFGIARKVIPRAALQQRVEPAYEDPNITDAEIYEDDYEESPMDSYDGESEAVEGMTDEQVAGWFLNRPYRTGSEYLATIQKKPGLAFSLRELYNRGLRRDPTSLSTLASALL